MIKGCGVKFFLFFKFCIKVVSWLNNDLFAGLSVSVPGLEKSLHQYTLEPSEKPFDMKTVPLATAPITEQKTGVNRYPHCL